MYFDNTTYYGDCYALQSLKQVTPSLACDFE